MKFTAEMIAGFLEGEIEGDKNATVWTFAKIEEGVEGALSFLSNPKYEQHLYSSESSIIIVDKKFEPKKEVKATMVRVEDSYASFAKLLQLYEENLPRKKGVHKLSAIAESATIGEECYIGEYAVIGEGAKVGKNCQIYPQAYIGDNVVVGNNCTIRSGAKVYADCVVGNNVIIESCAVIGADGFGWAPQADGTYSRIPQLGNVILEDNVYIGANTCVDRATMGSTVIGKGVKLDNLIQIGHNCTIGDNTVAAAQTGIAGSTSIGKNCMFGGQVGIVGHLKIGDKVQIGSGSGISNNIADGEVYFGAPAAPVRQYQRSHAVFRNLPTLDRDVHTLKKEVEKLKNELEGK